MPKPLPLAVYGPITPLSPAVRVTGVLPGAEVQVFANGNPVGRATTANPGFSRTCVLTEWVPG